MRRNASIQATALFARRFKQMLIGTQGDVFHTVFLRKETGPFTLLAVQSVKLFRLATTINFFLYTLVEWSASSFL